MAPRNCRVIATFLACSVAFTLLATCGGKHGSNGQQDAASVCQGDEDCTAGHICVGNLCVLPPDGGVDAAPPTEPAIVVSPDELDFGFAPLRVDTVLPLTVRNEGTADLQITAILVEEVDQVQEFHSNPEGVQTPALVIPPGESYQIQVTLHPMDGELDDGQLRIISNDPEQPSLSVPLRSGYKGVPDLEACVLDAAIPDPEPFVDCVEDTQSGDSLIDFGVVQFQQDATRLVAVRNLADGNAPLTISSIAVTNTTGLAGHFSLEFFWLETNPTPVEVPVTLPVYLRAADPLLSLPADHLFIRVHFDGDLDGALPDEDLVLQSDDTPGTLAIPIRGVVSGCPTGTWDINGDPGDGCEYVCNYTGPESCDGVDNDCDGDVDEQDAQGCTVYHRDADYDTYGVTADARCLCQPDTTSRHTAVTPGDCNDTKNTVHPGMLENCGTPDDDDCDGDTNDLNAYGCTIFYADQDMDSFGVTADARCLCVPTTLYRATVGGDCDDSSPDVRPNRTEDCNTPQDDNCSGSSNDEGAQNCVTYFFDSDSDGYGLSFLSKCLCAAQGDYRALLPSDCNDSNGLVNPGVPEDCNTSYDDNCNGDTNDLGATACSTYFFDSDNDGYGVTGNTQCRCAPQSNYRATVGGDCDDMNPGVRPSAIESCSTPYDDNCDGSSNDLNATGCSIFYYDGDQDTYGLVSNPACRCVAQGFHTATVIGDCNDANAAVNPGVSENCNTTDDDNCSGSNNDLNAVGCTNFFMDVDGDAYGNGLIPGECHCAASAMYRALVAGDCNDSLSSINPGIPETCDGIDNNCAGGIDEGFNLLTDTNHCGTCNHVCVNDHGGTSCVNGLCTPVCTSGWGDCNGDPSDGCETDLGTVPTCGACTMDANCPNGFYCTSSNVCAEKKPDGDPCTRREMCQSNECVDGVCCATSCSGTCESCAITGSLGTCTPHGTGLDPDNECTSTAQSTCGLNGYCDGNRACALWPTGTVCTSQSCSGNTVTFADLCNGSGTCTDGGSSDCSPYLCDSTACRTSCTDSTHCVAGFYCTGGACVSKKPNGSVCLNVGECLSGNCADGVCCDTPCSGLCRSCALAATLGICSNIALGLDPENECSTCRTCNGAGGCVNVADGVDPKSDCTTLPASSCTTDGQCNGTGGCRLWVFGTECAAQTCSGSTKYFKDSCNGAGTCVDGGSISCAPFLCDAAGFDCRSTCTSNADCIATSFCNLGTNLCDGKLGNGLPCTDGAQCLSNNCADGVCCNTACAGTCVSCALSGLIGTCSSIPANQDPGAECAGTCQSCNGSGACAPSTAGLDPENECAAQTASSCSTDGQCNGAGGCRLWASGTECAAQTCTGSTLYLPDTCDGTGTCSDNGSASCSPYQCNSTSTACRTDCSLDANCVSGYYCAAGLCVLKQTQGLTCTAANQCASNFCVDGYCCNNDCVGTCRACNVAGALGTCTNHTLNTDPENGCGTCRICDGAGSCANATAATDPKNSCGADPQASCGLDGQCNGAGACSYWASGAVCVTANCLDLSTLALADTCNGTGLCVDQGTLSCSPYLCSAGACRTTCLDDAQCVSGYFCNGTSCVSKLSGGQPCAGANQCQSGFCSDGYCCNEACTGLCRACNRAGSLGVCTPYGASTDPEVECGQCQVCNGSGTCVPATSGSDPKSECAPTDQSTCGFDGECNGTGGCRHWSLGTICVPQSCTGTTRSLADTCNGAGSCLDGGSASCLPYVCSGTVCGSSCTLQTDCATGYYCGGSGSCLPKKASGQSCSNAFECDSTYCADGVCCNSACAGPCRACNISGSAGSCTNYSAQTDPESECGLCQACSAGACVSATNGTDPKNECASSAQASCGLDGTCSGTGACAFWPSSTVCMAESCTNHIRLHTDYCSGAGTCVDGGTQDCSPYECEGSSCRSSCTSDLHCIAGYYCAGTACVAKKPNGQTCTAANQCSGGNCADGYCCDSACTGACRSCAITGSLGTCTYLTANTDPEAECGLCRICDGAGACAYASNGSDPKSQCAQASQSTCQLDGQCDGAGLCRLWGMGTQCMAVSCTGSTLYPADLCDGTGTCVESGSSSCGAYTCNAAGNACRTSCAINGDCSTGYYCNASSQCVPTNPLGTSCTGDSQCASGLCRDGYCCNGDCSGACRACNLTGFLGTCTNYLTNSDPENDCPLCQVCNGSGACVNVTVGNDPLNECASEGQSTCGLRGDCNGSGACAYYASGVTCVAQSCVVSTLHLADTCNGSGACIDNSTQPCTNNLTCLDGSSCRTNCSEDSHCVSGYYCGGGICQAKKTNGNTCGGNSECTSGYCVDGVCCNSDCAGLCRACNRSGSIGTCSNYTSGTDPETDCGGCQVCDGLGVCAAVAAGSDPKNFCAQQAASTCGTDGDCDGSGACRIWTSGTICVAQFCTGSTLYNADLCNGTGSCVDAGSASCGAYMCNAGGTACRASCTVDTECTTGNYCNASNLCVPKLTSGTVCATANQCTSGFCVDGYCCTTACAGACRSCAVSGSLGTCTNHVSNTDPEAECGLCRICDGVGACISAANGTDPKSQCAQSSQSTCQLDGQCDGSGACRLWASSTQCLAVSCVGSTLFPADLCDGTGTCVDSGSSPCGAYTCNAGGTACRTSCSINGDCSNGYYCNASNLCVPTNPLGTSCTGDTQCASGLCRDGYCCNSDCSGACRACHLTGFLGTCTSYLANTDPENDCPLCQVCGGTGSCVNVTVGNDPLNECATETQSTCGLRGDCNGSGACAFYSTGVACVAQTCVGATSYLTDTCNGSGACVDNGSQPCANNLTCLDGTSCRSSCADDAHCVSGYYCGGGICQAKKTNGNTCGGNSECTSGYCVDGVCCNNDCAGLCRACNRAGSIGTCSNYLSGTDPETNCGGCQMCDGGGACTNVVAGADPKSFCTQQPASGCQTDGECDGVGACRLWASGTICVAQSCTGSTLSTVDQCNGTGACVDSGNTSCGAFMCNSAGTACRTSCSLDTECTTGNYCNVSNLCVPKLINGTLCTTGNQCSSGFCADGYCCNNACTGACRSCAIAGSQGACTGYTANTDPEAECGLCRICDGAMACVSATNGTDPKGQCSQNAASTCGQDGECDGTGTCRLWSSSTQCVAVACTGSTLYPADLCNGTGTCVDSGNSSCGAYVCNAAGNACRTSCTDNAHCQTGYYCNGSNLCVLQSGTGTPCTLDSECGSNMCRDNYCCNTDCSGACRACNLPGTQGTCTSHSSNTDPENDCPLCQVCNGGGTCVNVTLGNDPLGECATETQSSCGLRGDCNGSGACAFYSSGVTCISQSCAGNTLSLTDTCNGTGTCVDNGTQPCANNLTCLDGSSCRTSCSEDSHCVTGYYCGGGVCQAKKTNGNTCGGGSECTSGYCVDGVCCNNSCAGVCVACNRAGSIGTCSNHTSSTDPDADCGGCQVCDGLGACVNASAGTDPKSFCSQQPTSTCLNDGECNGSGACRLWASGTVCVSQSCTGSTLYTQDLCNGTGSCVDAGSVSCGAYQCNAGGTACRTSCALDTECTAGYYCNASNQCVSKLTNGISCTAGNQCSSGLCVDGYCCNTDCSGACQSCAIAGSVGTCTGYTSGTDPQAECGLCRVCNGASACTSATNGTDPKNQCSQSSQSTCSQDGECDGAGACRLWASSTQCVAVSCVGTTLYSADYCNGAGSCIDSGSSSCGAYTCNAGGTACRTTCSDNTNCSTGYYCNASNLCVPTNPPGTPCTLDSQCGTNLCRDGYCCNNDCSGACRACNIAGSLGTCTPHTSNTDPENDCPLCQVCNGSSSCVNVAVGNDPLNECATEAQSSCGLRGDCNGSGACAFYASGLSCVSQSCSGSTLSLMDTCNGSGSCVDNGSQPCASYLTCLDGSSCRTSCSDDAHCVTGYFCSSGSCQAKKTNGNTCGTGNECTSGYCVDGVCCNNDCSGLCRACNRAGSIGTCSNHSSGTDPELNCGGCQMCDGSGACAPVSAGTDPKSFCTQQSASGCQTDGECDGSSACRLWASGTVCISQSCSGSTLFYQDLCNGTGTCVDGGSASCGAYQCNVLGTACRTSCSLDSECTAGNYCNASSLCVPKLSNGVGCSMANQCSSNYCVDGYCCNGLCGGTCQSCGLAGSLGTCTGYTAGTDPQAECGLCMVCNGASACTNATNGTDPKNQCSLSSQSTCSQDGECNGSGACRLWASGTQCVSVSCVGSTLFAADFCNGTGTCVDSGSSSCGAYTCNAGGTACRASCSVIGDCSSGYWCNGSSQCVPTNPLGTTCTADSQCTSNLCRDGYCCNGDCSGACRACNIAGFLGTCTYYDNNTDPSSECGLCQVCNGTGSCANVTVGNDPLNECATDPQSSCDLRGDCNGSGACSYYSNGTTCVAQSCSGSTLSLTDTCNGSGDCIDNGTQACANNLTCLDGTSCRTTCTQDSHCVTGYYCGGGICQAKKSNGNTCGGGTECTSGYCVDGVCCNNDCSGACRACNRTGSIGICSNYTAGTDPEGNCGGCQMCDGAGACANVTSGTDPKSFCTQQPASGCQADGECNGSGACRLWSLGTVCVVQFCTGSTLYNPDLCNGTGACVDYGTTSCGAYMCNDGGTACRTNCTIDTQCTTGNYCNTSNLCVPKLTNGTVCSTGNQCTSGNCVDGYCCNSTCNSTCMACNVGGSLGTCTNVPTNTDPINECGLCRVCSSGACTPAGNGTDPKSQCADNGQSSCLQDGQCNGAGACRLWAAGTICISGTCSGSTAYPNDLCNGTGGCVDSPSLNCSPYNCSGGICPSTCSIDSNCISGYNCVPPYCCQGNAPESGTACGSGTLLTLYSSTGGTVDYIGNLVPIGTERWYRIKSDESSLTHDMRLYIWLYSNPNDEFRIEILTTDGYSPMVTDCTTPGSPCSGPITHYSWRCSNLAVCSEYDDTTFYVKVTRRVGATPTCNTFTLRMHMQLGGTGAPF